MSDFFEVITFIDVLFALTAALILTVLFKWVASGYRLVGIYGDVRVNYDRRKLKSVLLSCYELFPRENITFRGDTFKRGNRIQILTVENRKITGELVGANNDNMICLLTAKHIIAHELSHVLDISLADAIISNEEGN